MRFVFARSRRAFATQSTLVLKQVMAELVCQHVAEHESPERVVWPHDDPCLIEFRACVDEAGALEGRQSESEPPGRGDLVVHLDSAWRHEPPEEQPIRLGGRLNQFDALDPVVVLLAEDIERTTNFGGRRRMMTTGGRPPSAHEREVRATRSTNPARVTAEAAGHVAIIAHEWRMCV
jgi:hypothetical protein